MMRAVNIAELKNRLSAYLQQVRAGEEILIRDRHLPIAKLVPLASTEASAEEIELAAAGKLRLPLRELDEEAFWKIGPAKPRHRAPGRAVKRVISEDREERDSGLLGR